MAEKRIIRQMSKKKVRVKSKKKVAPLSKQTVFHIGKSVMSWQIDKPILFDSFDDEIGDGKSCYEILRNEL